MGLIKKETNQELSNFFGFSVSDFLKKGKMSENSINSWIVITEIALLKRKQIDRNEIEVLSKLLNSLYRIFGFEKQNPYYRSFKLMIRRIAINLADANIIKDRSDKALAEALEHDFRGSFSEFNDLNYKPSQIITDNLKLGIIKLFSKPEFRPFSDLKDLCLDIIEYFENENEIFPSHNQGLHILNDYEESHRKDLIKNILLNCPQFNNVKSIRYLSRILFGDKGSGRTMGKYLSQNFLQSDSGRVHLRPEMHILFRIIASSETWSSNMLREYGVLLNNVEVEIYKNNVQQIIRQFIFSNLYSNPYIKEEIKRGIIIHNKDYLESEYDLILSMFLVTSAYYDKIEVTFEDLNQLFGTGKSISKFLDPATTEIGTYTLKRYYAKLVQLNNTLIINQSFNTFSYSQKVKIFKEAFAEILEYAYERNKNFLPQNHDLYERFKIPEVVGYHLIELVKRDLGFDILSFRPLKDDIFSNFSYIRHHFRKKDIFMKPAINKLKSSRLNDIVLTNRKLHGRYKAFHSSKGEQVIQILVNIIQELRKSKEPINEKKIILLFSKYKIKWLLDDEWLRHGRSSFLRNINEFNKRKEIVLKEKAIKSALIKLGYINLAQQFYSKYEYVLRNKQKYPEIFT